MGDVEKYLTLHSNGDETVTFITTYCTKLP
jgi:hypothetical protein